MHICARYLSPDADELLESVDPDTVYAIGTVPCPPHPRPPPTTTTHHHILDHHPLPPPPTTTTHHHILDYPPPVADVCVAAYCQRHCLAILSANPALVSHDVTTAICHHPRPLLMCVRGPGRPASGQRLHEEASDEVSGKCRPKLKADRHRKPCCVSGSGMVSAPPSHDHLFYPRCLRAVCRFRCACEHLHPRTRMHISTHSLTHSLTHPPTHPLTYSLKQATLHLPSKGQHPLYQGERYKGEPGEDLDVYNNRDNFVR